MYKKNGKVDESRNPYDEVVRRMNEDYPPQPEQFDFVRVLAILFFLMLIFTGVLGGSLRGGS
jgi:hypothetical protein